MTTLNNAGLEVGRMAVLEEVVVAIPPAANRLTTEMEVGACNHHHHQRPRQEEEEEQSQPLTTGCLGASGEVGCRSRSRCKPTLATLKEHPRLQMFLLIVFVVVALPTVNVLVQLATGSRVAAWDKLTEATGNAVLSVVTTGAAAAAAGIPATMAAAPPPREFTNKTTD